LLSGFSAEKTNILMDRNEIEHICCCGEPVFEYRAFKCALNICSFRPEKRIGYKAYDGLNSLFNLKVEIPRIKHGNRQNS
jgi:hypothetical protein